MAESCVPVENKQTNQGTRKKSSTKGLEQLKQVPHLSALDGITHILNNNTYPAEMLPFKRAKRTEHKTKWKERNRKAEHTKYIIFLPLFSQSFSPAWIVRSSFSLLLFLATLEGHSPCNYQHSLTDCSLQSSLCWAFSYWALPSFSCDRAVIICIL